MNHLFTCDGREISNVIGIEKYLDVLLDTERYESDDGISNSRMDHGYYVSVLLQGVMVSLIGLHQEWYICISSEQKKVIERVLRLLQDTTVIENLKNKKYSDMGIQMVYSSKYNCFYILGVIDYACNVYSSLKQCRYIADVLSINLLPIYELGWRMKSDDSQNVVNFTDETLASSHVTGILIRPVENVAIHAADKTYITVTKK